MPNETQRTALLCAYITLIIWSSARSHTISDRIFIASKDEGAWDSECVLELNVLQTPDGWVMIDASDLNVTTIKKDFGIGYALIQIGDLIPK